ncbi:MAG: potassium transporter Kup [Polyangiaceae bacterium]|nr:potassium transporter Kup [Polyangiaceae bacterium]
MHAPHAPEGHPSTDPLAPPGRLRLLALAALGVVFGDIGTSPLYTIKECVHGERGVPPTPANVLGVLSLIFWSLMMVVTVKYLTFVMRADNQGEGGILALLALVPERMRTGKGSRLGGLAALVLIGAALLYGDGVITPAISVLSAVEGLRVATHALDRAVVPITCAILLALFSIQRHGTEKVGKMLGPVMLLWFLSIGALGARFIAMNPAVLAAMNPAHGARFFAAHGLHGLTILGAVVLAITGAEALYADMGHFGRAPIRLAWYGLVLPALVLNYFGQGALLLQHPEAAVNPFFALVPRGPLTYALVGLSTAATVIASQALISGAYSLTYQAIQLGYLPRARVKHTSMLTEGQIYISGVSWAMAIACVMLVIWFRESGRLAAAYGIAVTGTMSITSITYFVVTRRTWGWALSRSVPLLALFLSFDLAFFGANLTKLFEGGYVPAVIAAVIFTIMSTWKRGRVLLSRRLHEAATRSQATFERLVAGWGQRVPGTAVVLTATPVGIPAALAHHAERTRVLHETVLLLTVLTEHVPRVPIEKSVEAHALGGDLYRVLVHIGFMQTPDVPHVVERLASEHALPIDLDALTYYVGRERLLATGKGEMKQPRERLFAFMSRNAASPDDFYGLPLDQVVEIGLRVDL